MNKALVAEEIFKVLTLYPKIQVEKDKFVQDLSNLPEETLLFLYQGLVEIEDLRSGTNTVRPMRGEELAKKIAGGREVIDATKALLARVADQTKIVLIKSPPPNERTTVMRSTLPKKL